MRMYMLCARYIVGDGLRQGVASVRVDAQFRTPVPRLHHQPPVRRRLQSQNDLLYDSLHVGAPAPGTVVLFFILHFSFCIFDFEITILFLSIGFILTQDET